MWSCRKNQVAKTTINAIREALLLRNHTKLRSFLGLCYVHRTFVSGFANIAVPLNEMLKKGTPSEFYDLVDEQYNAYQNLKEHLVDPPVLALPRANKPYILDTDAFTTQMGCTFFPEQDCLKDSRPVCYWSRSLTKAKKTSSTTEKEFLGVVW